MPGLAGRALQLRPVPDAAPGGYPFSSAVIRTGPTDPRSSAR